MGCLKPTPPNCGTTNICGDCPPCPDFQIKQHDTRPPFKVAVEDENGPMDLTDLVLEASMWIESKLKKDIDSDDTVIELAGNIGFDQILPNDIIIVDNPRSPEYMIIDGFDETNKTITVTRGYNATTARAWKKGTKLRIFRVFGGLGVTEMVYEDVQQADGCVLKDQLTESVLVYEWNPNDTCAAGCFSLEFKLIKMTDTPSVTPSAISVCSIGEGVEWVRRFPVCGEFVIKVCDSPTIEL